MRLDIPEDPNTGTEVPSSIRDWLQQRLPKGELAVADALAFAEKSGRSKVTVYRQERELSYSARKGVFVKAKT